MEHIRIGDAITLIDFDYPDCPFLDRPQLVRLGFG